MSRPRKLDVRVEEYVLPKLLGMRSSSPRPKTGSYANEPISGTVSAEYTFGKPVKGELEIVASRYVGTWEEYATGSNPWSESHHVRAPASSVRGRSSRGRRTGERDTSRNRARRAPDTRKRRRAC